MLHGQKYVNIPPYVLSEHVISKLWALIYFFNTLLKGSAPDFGTGLQGLVVSIQGENVWDRAGVPVHPKDEGWGWGKDEVKSSSSAPNCGKHFFMELVKIIKIFFKYYYGLKYNCVLQHYDVTFTGTKGIYGDNIWPCNVDTQRLRVR